MRQAEEAALAGPEGRAGTDDHLAVRVWLRLLSSSLQIEGEIRKRLRARFGISLARFDVLAQLARHPGGLQMSRLSSFLMVTGGNVTGLTVELERDGYVLRERSAQDRRAVRVRLTGLGEREFARMAREHEAWVCELLQGLSPAAQQSLHDQLGRLRSHLTTLTSGVSAARRKGAR